MMMLGGATKLVETGSFTPDTDVNAKDNPIQHSLGVVPEFIIVMADEFAALTSMTERYIANCYFSKTNIKASNVTGSYFAWYATNWHTRDTLWNTYEQLSTAKFANDSTFVVPYYQTIDKLKAGITYHYVIGTYA